MERIILESIGRGPDPCSAELKLQRLGNDGAVSVVMPLAQARELLIEMQGMGSDRCGHHHLIESLQKNVGFQIKGVVLKAESTDTLEGIVQVETPLGVSDISANVASALSLALHLGIPMFWDSSEPRKDTSTPAQLGVPKVFQQVIDEMSPQMEDMGTHPTNDINQGE